VWSTRSKRRSAASTALRGRAGRAAALAAAPVQQLNESAGAASVTAGNGGIGVRVIQCVAIGVIIGVMVI
jgi:hypothetical protein